MIINRHHIGTIDAEVSIAAESDKSVLRNLLGLYKYDDSEHTSEDPDMHGLFEYRYLDHYFTPSGQREEGRTAFLFRADGKLAGFALVANFSTLSERSAASRSMAEFFILRKWRRRGLGRFLACTVFDHCPGEWEVKQESANKQARLFWRHTIDSYTSGQFEQIDCTPPLWDGPILLFSNR